MLSPEFHDRSERLVQVGLTERRRQVPHALTAIDAECAAAGAYQSGRRFIMIHQTIARELDVRAIIVWKSLVRAHQAIGVPLDDTLAAGLKHIFSEYLSQTRMELDQLLDEKIAEGKLRERFTLEEAFSDSHNRHDIEIDLYVDSLRLRVAQQQETVMTQTYNFYGAVGAVQTGAGAVANNVQNLGEEERRALLDALNQVRAAVESLQELALQRQDLIEIADECATIIQSATPNNSKLRAMFDVLSSSVQTIANAQPAYQALKAALLPLGFTLP